MAGATRRIVVIASAAIVLALPLAGGLLAGGTLDDYTQFPPRLNIPHDYVHVSNLALAGIGAVIVFVAAAWFVGCQRRRDGQVGASAKRPRYPFPTWGWLALLWTAGWWVLAWSRWEWAKPLQHYTFFPLWLGFIVSVNALIERRTGSCLMWRAPGRWLALFGASAGCWWAFEWLNRFVRNWHYLNVEDFGAVAYFVHATVCFSTVLPAVAAVAEWLSSHGGWDDTVTRGPAWSWLARRDAAIALVVFGCASLFASGYSPLWFYPALWISPLVVFLAIPVLSGERGLAAEMAGGDWTRAASWIVGSLVCGFFWEMWNWHSLAKWIYTVPGVERWHLFEMPALGYAGYLPFGLECLLVAEWTIGDRWRPAPAPKRKPANL